MPGGGDERGLIVTSHIFGLNFMSKKKQFKGTEISRSLTQYWIMTICKSTVSDFKGVIAAYSKMELQMDDG